MTAAETSRLLAQDAERVCRLLLPSGKIVAGDWRCGDVAGNPGQSLSVQIVGNNAGRWKDFANGKGGDLIDLWAQVNDISLGQAISEAKKFLGIQEKKFFGGNKQFVKPRKLEVTSVGFDCIGYLTTTRGLSEETCEAYKIASQDGQIIFPHYRDGDILAIKYMRIAGDKKSKWRWEKGCEPILFGWQAIHDNAREVVICEGHLDALSWYQLGYPALSIPNGAQSHEWIDRDYEHLSRFDKIFLSFDADDAGQSCVAEVCERLGRDRTYVVQMPPRCKDANEVITHGKQSEAEGLIRNAQTLDPSELKHASAYSEKALSILAGEEKLAAGYRLPWHRYENAFRFRPGELTILAGENFHGKSQACGNFIVDCLAQGARACVASLEYKPAKWIANAAKQASAVTGNITRDYAQACIDWVSQNLWVFDVSSAKTTQIFDCFEYARRRYGVDLFVIDNLQKCGLGDDDYNGQKKFAESLSDFARDNDVHVILVHHLRKSEDEMPRNKSAIKGSGGITDMANNVVIWWRNRIKERDKEAIDDWPDASMIVEKQRETGETPKINLWFDKHSGQFCETKDRRIKYYVKFERGQ